MGLLSLVYIFLQNSLVEEAVFSPLTHVFDMSPWTQATVDSLVLCPIAAHIWFVPVLGSVCWYDSVV